MTVPKIRKLFEESMKVKSDLIKSDSQLKALDHMAITAANAIQSGNKMMLCGNGGSAADAQHLAAEMLVRLRPGNNREGIPAISLAQDTSTITACGNDFGFETLYKRVVSTIGNPGDILFAITTSGNSENIILAMEEARRNNVIVFGLLGGDGGRAKPLCDRSFVVPSDVTGRIQESHITAGHALMESIEDQLIDAGYIQLQN